MIKFRISNGYRLLYMPDHESSYSDGNWKGYVYEHILKAESMMGRKLRPEEEVHHLDFNKLNNEQQNLLVLEKSQHTKLHNWMSSCGIGEKSPNVNRVKTVKSKEVCHCSECGICLDRYQRKFCSRKCASSSRSIKLSREEVLELVKVHNGNLSRIGKLFNVSGNSVKKWIVKHNISMAIPCQARDTLREGVETSGEVKSS